jgi:N-acetylglutamate synthase-like GNAT family acetyltransferase
MDRQTIIAAIERTDSLVPAIPGLLEYLTIPGATACITPAPDPMANRVSSARLSAENAAAAIGHLREFYGSRGAGFCWTVGPNSMPPDLGRRLQEGSFRSAMTLDGMYRTDLNLGTEPDRTLRIIEQPLNNLGRSIETMAEGFELAVESSRYYHDRLIRSREVIRSRIYLAFVEGSDRPVGCAHVSYFPDQPIALLCGAVTLPEHRGRGIYRAMIARRLADARHAGMEVAIVVADQTTSAAVCAEVGFVRACRMQRYVWEP